MTSPAPTNEAHCATCRCGSQGEPRRCKVPIVRQDPWIMGDYHRELCELPVKAGEAYCPHHLMNPASGQCFRRAEASR